VGHSTDIHERQLITTQNLSQVKATLPSLRPDRTRQDSADIEGLRNRFESV
jgi:hypothetical protein